MSDPEYQPGLRAGGGRRRRKKARPAAWTEFRGVSLRPKGKFGAQIWESRYRWLGTFDTAEDAARAYDAAAVELHGAMAVTNFKQPATADDGGISPLLDELSGQDARMDPGRVHRHPSPSVAPPTRGSKGKAALSLGPGLGGFDLTPAERQQADELLMGMDCTEVSYSICSCCVQNIQYSHDIPSFMPL
jgi:hypothetical protein